MKTKFVVGFVLTQFYEKVVLIRKQRPDWQQGKLNGLGGHVEAGESYAQAISREVFEECGLSSNPDDWMLFCNMVGTDFKVACFVKTIKFDVLETITTKTDEQVVVLDIEEVNHDRVDVVPNLPVLIQMAILWSKQSHFSPATIKFP